MLHTRICVSLAYVHTHVFCRFSAPPLFYIQYTTTKGTPLIIENPFVATAEDEDLKRIL